MHKQQNWPVCRRHKKKNHKHNTKLNKNLEISIQKQIKISSKSSKNNIFIVKNKHQIATRTRFVLVKVIRDEVECSLPKDESKPLLEKKNFITFMREKYVKEYFAASRFQHFILKFSKNV